MSKTLQKSPYHIADSDLIMSADSNVYGSSSGLVSAQNTPRQYVLRVRDLPEENKPRERLMNEGVAALSMQELLAIVLVSGNTKEGVLEMSQRTIREYGTNALLNHVDPQALSADLDIPIVKACQVVAVGELGRRLYKKNDRGLSTIRNAQEAYEYLKDMHSLPKEQMRGIYLDTHNRVIHDEVIAVGTINSNVTHPREVFRPALQYNAAALILAHNHPSGIAEASRADIEVTQQLVSAGKMIGVHVLDHIIVTADGFISIEADY